MNFNRLLERQVNKLLPGDIAKSPEMEIFLKTISETYNTFDRDKDIAERAFRLSELEFIEINAKLKEEITLRKKSVDKLHETLGIITGNTKFSKSDNLFSVVEHVNQEITDRKSTQSLFITLIANLQNGILMEDTSGKIIYVNQIFAEVFKTGRTPEDLAGKEYKYLLKEIIKQFKEAPHFGTLRNKSKVGREPVAVNKIELKDGRFLDGNIIPIYFEEEFRGYLWTFTDITESIRSQAALNEQKKLTEEILNNIPADIALFDNQHNYLYVNPSAIRDKERRAAVIGKSDFDYFRMRGMDDSKAIQRRGLFNKAVESKSTIEWLDAHEKKDGDTIYMLRRFTPYFEGDILKYVLGYAIDISDRINFENRLNKTIAEVQKINKELEQFAYVVSHDLQEPLRMVKSFIQLLDNKIGGSLDDTDKTYFNFVKDGAERMQRMIQDLLEYSRVDNVTEIVGEVDCSEIVKSVMKIFKPEIERVNAKIKIDDLPNILGIKSKIHQLFQNLIGNALKYRNKENTEIEIGFIEEDQFYQFFVKDNGIGIDPKYFDKIFVIFQRLHNKNEYSGTGIGLAICKKIVELHGGKIWVDSKLQNGTTFYFTIAKAGFKK